MGNAYSMIANSTASFENASFDRNFLRNMDMRGYPAQLFDSVERRLVDNLSLAGFLSKKPLLELVESGKGTLKELRLADGSDASAHRLVLMKPETMPAKGILDLTSQRTTAPRSDEQIIIPFDRDRFLRPSA